MTREQINALVESIFTEEERRFVMQNRDDAFLIERDITMPAILRINEATKQENDSKYWAYMLQYWSSFG